MLPKVKDLKQAGKRVCLRFTIDGLEVVKGSTVVSATIKWLNIREFS